MLPPDSTRILSTPRAVREAPAAGKRVLVTPKEYAGTQVFHTLYLPTEWKPGGRKLPIIFEYTGNFFPASGSTGEPEDAGLGYGLSGGKYIWVSLPYISQDGKDNQVTWWGDTAATVNYAKTYVPQIVRQYNADPNNVFLCGFSRGAIGVNFLGLHDDEIAKLWTAFISHDHFDGVRQWGGTKWGSPLATYREQAAVRLKRVGDRPYLVSQNGKGKQTEELIRSVLPDAANFRINAVSTPEIFGRFPNEFAKHPHTDRWLSKPGVYRTRTWRWMNDVVGQRQSSVPLGELIFADQFERSESQELKDEPGNHWTTSSEKTAAGNKQVDLRDGAMHVATHESANHATSVRHAFSFQNGTIAMRFQLPTKKDSLKLNFADLGCKSVHAGHLFNVIVRCDKLTVQDLKTGRMNLEIRKAKKSSLLSKKQAQLLKAREKSFALELRAKEWHELYVHVDGDRVIVEIDGQGIATFRAVGFAHETKTLIRLLVEREASFDDVRIWRRK